MSKQVKVITPHKYTIRGRAEYDVAMWNNVLNDAPELLNQHYWNRKVRNSVDALLAEAGFAPDSSVRHQLALMSFDAIAKATGESHG